VSSVRRLTPQEHLARATLFRDRAARCDLSARDSNSARFSECYRLLAANYVVLARLEEDFVARQIDALTENRLLEAAE
jgi:hypothetical protein